MTDRKVNKYAHLSVPQATLDFHNRGSLTPTAIMYECRDFIQGALDKKLTRVLIITGKGLHSKEGPIVKPTVQEFLASAKNIKKFQEARRDRGGGGAFEVWL